MIDFLLDTDICIYLIKHKPPQVIARLRELPLSTVAISSITLSELEYGVMKSSRPKQNTFALMQFAVPLEILPFDDLAAREYGYIRSFLEKQGTPIGSLDTLIAAHALALDCILVTNNQKEFGRVPGLKTANWVNS